jgi:hypothetical protein
MIEWDKDNNMKARVAGARLYHHRFEVKTWLPIPMPVGDYEQLVKDWTPWKGQKGRTFRIAHSPTVRAIKGTDALLSAVESLHMQDGLPVEVVLIEGLEHGEALRLKATCDATFDSFWLGIQGSGLEAAAMRQAVLAGDPDVVKDYGKAGIPLPYTYTHDRDELKAMIQRMVTEPSFYAAEAAKVAAYVREWHDYPKVGARIANFLKAD